MSHEPSGRCFDDLESAVVFHVTGQAFSREAVDRFWAGFDELWRLWSTETTPPRWSEILAPTSDPVQAAYRDANARLGTALSWTRPKQAPRLNRDRLSGDDLAAYERKMGEIAHHIRAVMWPSPKAA